MCLSVLGAGTRGVEDSKSLLAQRLRVYTRTTLLIHVVLRVSTLSPKHAVHALSLKYNARPLWPEGTLVDDRA